MQQLTDYKQDDRQDHDERRKEEQQSKNRMCDGNEDRKIQRKEKDWWYTRW